MSRLGIFVEIDVELWVSRGLGLVIARRSLRASIPVFEQALAAFDQLPAAMRTSAYGRENEFIVHCAIARSLAAAGRSDDARAQADQGLALAAGDLFHVATCELLVAMMWRELGDHDAAATRFESVARALRPMIDKADTSAVIGTVEALQQLAELRPAEACSFHDQALTHWRSRPATTAYLHRRQTELERAAAGCHAATK